MPWASFSMLDGPGGTGCDVPVRGCWVSIETNLEILHTLPKGPKLNTTKKYEIHKHYKQSPTNILNDQTHYKSHTLFDTIKHSSHNNISVNPTTMNRKINFNAAFSTGIVKH